MDPIIELALRQGGVFTRQQALMAGLTEQEIRKNSRIDGPWVVVRRSVYAERRLVEALDPYDGLMQLQDRAAHVLLQRPHLMTHDSAARAWRLPMLRPEDQLVHVTRFGVGGSRTTHGVKHHLTQVGLLGTSALDGMNLSGLARTALDLAREHGWVTGAMACDAARRRGATASDFVDQLALMWCWPGVTQARRAFEFSDAGAESGGETLLRVMLEGLGLGGEPTTQFPVLAAGRLFWADLRVGRHLFEFDGFTKFQRPERGGTAQKAPEEVAWDEKRRQDVICGEGFGMSRVTWPEFFGQARRDAVRRLQGEVQTTTDRFGWDLTPAMAEFAASMAAERARRMRDRDLPLASPLDALRHL
jgi:hypothetical protein